MADVGRLEALWRQMGNTGDRPAGWYGPGGSPENPNYTPIAPPHVPTADEILGEEIKRVQEQVTFLKDFLASNPTGYDEVLARQMAQEKFKPYYEEILSDFVNPLQEKMSRSTADENKAISELTRQTELGSSRIKFDTQTAIERAKEGFAGSGLFGSGTASRATAVQGIQGNEKLADFTAQAEYKKTGILDTGMRERSDYQTAIDQKRRDIFGTGREYDTAVAGDVQTQQGNAQKQLGIKTLDALTSRFGQPISGWENYLNLGA